MTHTIRRLKGLHELLREAEEKLDSEVPQLDIDDWLRRRTLLSSAMTALASVERRVSCPRSRRLRRRQRVSVQEQEKTVYSALRALRKR